VLIRLDRDPFCLAGLDPLLLQPVDPRLAPHGERLLPHRAGRAAASAAHTSASTGADVTAADAATCQTGPTWTSIAAGRELAGVGAFVLPRHVRQPARIAAHGRGQGGGAKQVAGRQQRGQRGAAESRPCVGVHARSGMGVWCA
jgi:hypothetical protein